MAIIRAISLSCNPSGTLNCLRAHLKVLKFHILSSHPETFYPRDLKQLCDYSKRSVTTDFRQQNRKKKKTNILDRNFDATNSVKQRMEILLSSELVLGMKKVYIYINPRLARAVFCKRETSLKYVRYKRIWIIPLADTWHPLSSVPRTVISFFPRETGAKIVGKY